MLHLIEMFIFLNLFDCSFSSIGNSANLHIKLYRTEKRICDVEIGCFVIATVLVASKQRHILITRQETQKTFPV